MRMTSKDLVKCTELCAMHIIVTHVKDKCGNAPFVLKMYPIKSQLMMRAIQRNVC